MKNRKLNLVLCGEVYQYHIGSILSHFIVLSPITIIYCP